MRIRAAIKADSSSEKQIFMCRVQFKFHPYGASKAAGSVRMGHQARVHKVKDASKDERHIA